MRANRKYPPINLGDMFADRPDVLKVMTSARFQKEKRWKEVEGPYTEKGHYRVLRNVKEGAGLLEREQWVVPLTAEEKPDRVPVNIKHLAEEYDQRYAEQWTDWLLDITVQSPATVKDAIELYATLGRPECPYLRILRTLEDHTQWKSTHAAAFENEELQREAKRRVPDAVADPAEGHPRRHRSARRSATAPAPCPPSSGAPPSSPSRARRREQRHAARTSTSPSSTRPARHPPARGGLAQRRTSIPARSRTASTTRSKRPRICSSRFDDKAKAILTPLLTNPLKIVTARLPAAGTGKVAIPAGGRRFPKR